MKAKQPSDPGPRIFILTLDACEIVYLPETGQIVSRLPRREATRRREKNVAARPVPEDDGDFE